MRARPVRVDVPASAAYGAPAARLTRSSPTMASLRSSGRTSATGRTELKCRRRARPAPRARFAVELDDQRAAPASRTPTRSKGTSRTCRGSTSRTAPASRVHPAPWYIGVEAALLRRSEDRPARPRSSRSRRTARCVPGVPVTVTLTQVQWNSVRRAEGNGFYTWDTEEKVPAGTWTRDAGASPCRSHSAPERRLLRARARERRTPRAASP